MRRKRIGLVSILLLALVYTAGCSSSSNASDAETTRYEENVELYLEEVSYDNEVEVFSVVFSTNIKSGTQGVAKLLNSKHEILEAKPYTIKNNYQNEWNHVRFGVRAKDLIEYEVSSVYLELEIDSEGNYGFSGNSNVDVLTEQYKDSEFVKVKSTSHLTNIFYVMNIKSEDFPLDSMVITLPSEDEEEVFDENYSNEFKEYNLNYYTYFKYHLDLITSNFEILAMDGFYNQNIVDDLVSWTIEFNEILDSYQATSIPVNEEDQKLHNHTVDMINEQRLVNEYILDGLAMAEEAYFIAAGNHLDNVVHMYLEGYNLLEK